MFYPLRGTNLSASISKVESMHGVHSVAGSSPVLLTISTKPKPNTTKPNTTMSKEIKVLDVLTTSIQGLSVQAYTADDGWRKGHVFQRAVIAEGHEEFENLKSLRSKAKSAHTTVSLAFNAWLESNEGFAKELEKVSSIEQWIQRIAGDHYDGVEWSNIDNKDIKKATRSYFKSLAKNECSVMYRLYRLKVQTCEQKVSDQAIKFVNERVDHQVDYLKGLIHTGIKNALTESGYTAHTEITDMSAGGESRITYAVLHEDFQMSLKDVEDRNHSTDKCSSMYYVIDVKYEGNGRNNYANGDKGCSIREVAIGHLKLNAREDGKEFRYFNEEDSIRIRSGNSNVTFFSKDKNQIKRIKALLNLVMHMVDINITALWNRQDWMSDVHVSE